jgi:asparaginyl-tRNA synthetase
MTSVYIEDIAQHEGQEVTLQGWLYNKRSSGKLHFLQVRDGTGVLQCVVFEKDVPPEQFTLADHITQESSLLVRGTVRADARAPLGYELSVKDLQLIQTADPYPITPKEHGVAFLLDHRHLWLRSSRQHAVLRVRSTIIRSCRDYFDGKGFTLIDAPIFTPAACEGTTTLFVTDYFGEQAYLTQSGQLYAEAGAFAFGKVYCFGPTFRAEKSKTRRHLTEFWMIEPEVAFPRITYTEAVESLRAQAFAIEWGADFGGDEETAISNAFDRPVLVHRYPVECKAFYMKADPRDPRLALCVDMLAPEGYGEIIGGGQREDDLATLERKIEAHQLPQDAFTWYLDLRRYGSVPHAGFGMGIERLVAWICGLHHVRETIPFPRMLERLRP